MANLYSLGKSSSGEMHLFESRKAADGSCHTTQARSECSKVLRSDAQSWNFTCLSESDARMGCAKIGRSVCGNCVATLYTT